MNDAAFNRLLGQAYWGATSEVLAAVDVDGELATRTGRGGETLLHHASMGRHAALVQGLLRRGADVWKTNDKGQGALHFAQGDAAITILLAEQQQQQQQQEQHEHVSGISSFTP